jgi:hypothetical protein
MKRLVQTVWIVLKVAREQSRVPYPCDMSRSDQKKSEEMQPAQGWVLFQRKEEPKHNVRTRTGSWDAEGGTHTVVLRLVLALLLKGTARERIWLMADMAISSGVSRCCSSPAHL